MGEQEQKLGAWAEFQKEAAACWAQMPHKYPMLGLLVSWLLLFQFLGNSTFGYVDTASLFRWLYTNYNAPMSEDGHGNLIPFAVIGLWWWKRKEWLAVPKAPWWPALIGFMAALCMHILAYAVQQPRVSSVCFFAGLYFLTGIVWGRAWLTAIFFPYVLFIFCIPISNLAELVTFPLRMIVTDISYLISHSILGIQVIREGTQLFDPRGAFQYEVAAPCSGIRSLIAMFALTTIYGFVAFEKSWKRLVMIILAVPLTVVGNVFRITSIIVAAEAFGQKAGDMVHEASGYAVFILALAVMLFAGWWMGDDKLPDMSPKNA